MGKKHGEQDCCYEEMSSKVGGQSQPSEYWHESSRNEYENSRKGFYGPNGFDWSGMEKHR